MASMMSNGGQQASRLLHPVRLAAWGLVAATLLAPAIAMQSTGEVDWTAFDFFAAAGLLIGAGLALELVLWRVRSARARTIIAIAIFAVVLLVWAQGAVNIF